MERFESFRGWLAGHRDELDAVVFDIDGVLVVGSEAVAGAAEVLALLRQHGCPFGLLTNDAHHSVAERVARLKQCGIEVGEEEITSSGHGLVEFVEERGLAGEQFFCMGDLGVPCYAELAGLRATRELSALPRCAGIVIGERGFEWEPAINAAINYFIDRPEGLLVLPNPDPLFKIDATHVEMASGAPAHLISHMLSLLGRDVQPIVLGKPHEPIFLHNHHVLQKRIAKTELPRNRVLMIGDSLASDIAGANAFGYRSALVLTGITHEDDLAAPPYPPELVFDRL